MFFGYSIKIIKKVYEQYNVNNLFYLFRLLINKVCLYLLYNNLKQIL